MTYIGMDNFALRVVGAWNRDGGGDHLTHVLALVLGDHRKVTGWAEANGALLLYWSNVDGVHPFPAPIANCVELHTMVASWLENHHPAPELSALGDTKELANGFEAWTDEWGRGGGDPYALLAIKPRTRWIGK